MNNVIAWFVVFTILQLAFNIVSAVSGRTQSRWNALATKRARISEAQIRVLQAQLTCDAVKIAKAREELSAVSKDCS